MCVWGLTSPPLSLSPSMLGCWASLTTASTGRSRPVLAGTLYRTTGTGLLSATCRGRQRQHRVQTQPPGPGHRIRIIMYLLNSISMVQTAWVQNRTLWHIYYDMWYILKTCGIYEPFVTRGQYFHFWKNNIPVVNRIFCQDKMLEYAYNWQLRIENTLKFPELLKYCLWV